MKDYDVVIIGAGPAGSTFARELEDEYDALLVDNNGSKRNKACAGLLTEKSLDYFENKNIEIEEDVLSEPREFDQVYLDWDNDLRNENGNLTNVNRGNFDEWLLQSIDNSVDKKLGTMFKDHRKIDDGIEILLSSPSGEEKIKSQYLVGCDGHTSSVRESCGIDLPAFRIAVQKKIDLDIDDVYFIFDSEINKFYSWLVPKEDHTLLGSGFRDSDEIKNFEILENKIKNKFDDYDHYSMNSGIMTLPGEEHISLGKDNVILCGEAAGLMSPSSGEGISYALKSADRAAEAFNEENDGNVLEKYETLIEDLRKKISEKERKYEIIRDPEERLEYFS